VIKALLLIFEPAGTWEGIHRARRSIAFIVGLYLLPLLLLVCVGEGYGLVNWGKWQTEVARFKRFPIGEAVVVEGFQLLVSLGVVFVGANLVRSIGETFHGRHTYHQAFTAVAYGLGPFFLLRLLDMAPGISPWAAWGIGIILSGAVLYQGVPRMMAPDPSHAFGLYLMSVLLLVLMTGLVRFVTAAYLQGKFPKLEAAICDVAARLPF
jgi:hypothetical protein